jgi:hypothetical protein
MVTRYPVKPWAGTRSPTLKSNKTGYVLPSAVQGIRQGNLMGGVRKIAKNNDLSKIKMTYGV